MRSDGLRNFLFNPGNFDFDIQVGALGKLGDNFLETWKRQRTLRGTLAALQPLAQAGIRGAGNTSALEGGIVPDHQPPVGGGAHVELKAITPMRERQLKSLKGVFGSVVASAA